MENSMRKWSVKKYIYRTLSFDWYGIIHHRVSHITPTRLPFVSPNLSPKPTYVRTWRPFMASKRLISARTITSRQFPADQNQNHNLTEPTKERLLDWSIRFSTLCDLRTWRRRKGRRERNGLKKHTKSKRH